MKPSVFIPEKLKVGFVERKKTETGRLSFVVCFDDKGKLKQEKSFDNWRDHNIDPQEWTNEPKKGFRIASSVIRTPSSDSYGQRTEKIRIIDPRGFEFEISVTNLIFILDHSNLNNQELSAELIYAWDKAKLILLPTSSNFYKENASKKNKKNFKTADLQIGETYFTSNPSTTYTYVGNFYRLRFRSQMKEYTNVEQLFRYGCRNYEETNTFSSVDELIKQISDQEFAKNIKSSGILLDTYINSFRKQHVFVRKEYVNLPDLKYKYSLFELPVAHIEGVENNLPEIDEGQIEEIKSLWILSENKPLEKIQKEDLKLKSFYCEEIDGVEFFTHKYDNCWRCTPPTICINKRTKKLLNVKDIEQQLDKNPQIKEQNEKIQKNIFDQYKYKYSKKKDLFFAPDGEIVKIDVKCIMFNGVKLQVMYENGTEIKDK